MHRNYTIEAGAIGTQNKGRKVTRKCKEQVLNYFLCELQKSVIFDLSKLKNQ